MNVELAQHPDQAGSRTSKIFGYGEDAFTLWALRYRLSDILREFQDPTAPIDCLTFYRPSFGRRGGKNSAEFGEFDAAIASSENIYLIESKWDNLSTSKKKEIILEEEQVLRHRIFSWYIIHWHRKYSNDWEGFRKEKGDDFENHFRKEKKRIVHTGRRRENLLARNLEFILTNLQERCSNFPAEFSIKNVMLFFYDSNKSTPPDKISEGFKLIPIDYGQEIEGNFVKLE